MAVAVVLLLVLAALLLVVGDLLRGPDRTLRLKASRPAARHDFFGDHSR